MYYICVNCALLYFCGLGIPMPHTIFTEIKEEWQEAWHNTGFRRKMTGGLALFIIISLSFPYFFQTIEARSGFLLNDPVLKLLPPHDVSAATFNIIWAVSLLSL